MGRTKDLRTCVECTRTVPCGYKGPKCARCYTRANPPTSRTKEQIRNNHLKKTYGITLEEAGMLSELQGGKCAICRCSGKLFVDHCHDSGVVRGLLCNHCNSMLGYAKDSVERLLAGASYLRLRKPLTKDVA